MNMTVSRFDKQVVTQKRTLGYGISNSTVTCRLIKFKPDGNRGLEPIEVPK